MSISVVEGDLLSQRVEVIVNTWNRNFIPWWLLLPQGVSGAIKRRGGGVKPFCELARYGVMQLGEAVLTNGGRLPFKGIIHVAGINLLWRASEYSIRASARNAMEIVTTQGFTSVAFPIIGAGSGSFPRERALEILRDELTRIETKAEVLIVRRHPERSHTE